MSTVQTDGVSSVTVTSTVNNGGSVVANGTTSVLTPSSPSSEKVGVFGSTPIDNDDADKAVSDGVFAHEHVKPITKRVTTELAGVANLALDNTGSSPELVRSIHKLEILRTRRQTLAIRNEKFDLYTGKFDEGFPVVAVDSLGVDNAANPTREIPGTLNFLYGGPSVSSVNYSQKNT